MIFCIHIGWVVRSYFVFRGYSVARVFTSVLEENDASVFGVIETIRHIRDV